MRTTRAAAIFLLSANLARAADPAGAHDAILPTGFRITPAAVPGTVLQPFDPGLAAHPGYTLGQAVSLALSPDGKKLLGLTSGFNRLADASGSPDRAASTEFVLVWSATDGAPRLLQALPVPNTGQGLAWRPDGSGFFVSGGVDDVVHVFTRQQDRFAESGPPIKLGHGAGLGVGEPPAGPVPPERRGHEAETRPMVAGIGIDPSGDRLLAADYQNDSVTLVDLKQGIVAGELDLRPGRNDPKSAGTPGGEFPLAVAWSGPQTAYVSSQRDREIVALDLSSAAPRITSRIAVEGQPNQIAANRAGTRLYAALDNSDTVAVIDTATARVIETIPALGSLPQFVRVRGFHGANPNGVALSPDESTLFVTEGGLNAVAMIALSRAARGETTSSGVAPAERPSDVSVLLPTGWYPNAVQVSPDGRTLFVANGKSVPGPNPDACRKSLDAVSGPAPCYAANQYVLQREKSDLAAIPLPSSDAVAGLTQQVAANMGMQGEDQDQFAARTLAELRRRIRHVIYIVKENRSYDQVLGDLPQGNGDPKLTLFPQPLTPNHHALASGFVLLDSFFDTGEVSGSGWNWSTAARATDFTEKTVPVQYAGRGMDYDSEGANRGIDVALSPDRRREVDPAIPADPDLLPGTVDVAAPDASRSGAANPVGTGYLWDAALRAGLTVRNYGFYLDGGHYRPTDRGGLPPSPHPFADHMVQAIPAKAALAPITDLYFRGFDQSYADFWRIAEWRREFDQYVEHGDLPALSLVRLPHDHFGNFADAADGLGTVEGQMADNDYALGLLVEAIAKSRYRTDTLIFVLEDDAQNGPDHIDAHRSIAFVAGPYVRQGSVISRRFTTVSVLRTIEDTLGLPPLGLYDAAAAPMAEIFDLNRPDWDYDAIVPAILRQSALPLPPASEREKHAARGCYETPRRTASWWDRATRGEDFSSEDRLDTARFNRVLRQGLNGGRPRPAACG